MAYRGHVRNGVVELDDPASLPEGAEVSVEMATAENPDLVRNQGESKGGTEPIPSLYEQFKDIVGIVPDGLPEDLARNHDHYLYGTPKK